MKEIDKKSIIERQIQAVIDKLSEEPEAEIVLSTYNREEFEELRRGEDYDAYKRQERAFAEGLASRGLLKRIRFQPITAAGYYSYLADHPELEPGEASRAAYAATLANKQEKEKEMNKKHYLDSLAAYVDEEGEVYGIADKPGDNTVKLFPNPTWEKSDYTDPYGRNWIRADRLGKLFSDLVEGIPVEEVCSACRIGRPKYRQYQSGQRPIPDEVWQTVDRLRRDRASDRDPDFAAALKKAKLTKRAASLKFGVCYNTIQNWAAGRSRLPQHVRTWAEKILSK